MQADDKQNLIEKQAILMHAISIVIKEIVKNSGKSGRKISEEYDIGLGVISKLERNIVSDVKISTLWKLANALDINPNILFDKICKNLPKDFNFYE